jgi:hypothetical protein
MVFACDFTAGGIELAITATPLLRSFDFVDAAVSGSKLATS